MYFKNVLFVALLGLGMNAMAAPVNVNSASAQEIASALKGIGPAKAQAISDYCQQSSCAKPEDLLNVKGIGAATLEKIREDLQFGDS
jgi:competence protein ComEA